MLKFLSPRPKRFGPFGVFSLKSRAGCRSAAADREPAFYYSF
jgi:hypothetical protein